jgi:hypothetical protein
LKEFVEDYCDEMDYDFITEDDKKTIFVLADSARKYLIESQK